MSEVWKVIEGTGGRYEVSNTGKIRSLNYNKTGEVKELKQKIDKYGYCTVILHIDKKQKYPTVHRLVAKAFISNPNNLPQVNHRDGNKQNNNVENLEWCTSSENVQHAFDIGLKEKSRQHARDNILKFNQTCKKEITAISIVDGAIIHFNSIKEASNTLEIKDIGKPLRKTTLTSNGYIFEYGHLSVEEAEKAKKYVIDSLGEKKFNSLLKKIETKRG